MVTEADVDRLSQLGGKELVRESARATGFLGIEDLWRQIETQRPQDLEKLSQGWEDVRTSLSENYEVMQRANQRVIDDWEGPAADGFSEYMGRFFSVYDTQLTEFGQIRGGLDEMKAALDSAEDALNNAILAAAGALGVAVAACVITLAAVGWTGVGALAALGELAVGILAALGIMLVSLNLAIDSKNDALTQAVDKIKLARDEGSAAAPPLSAVQLPPEPKISGPGLGSILKNLDSKFRWDD